MKYENKAVRQLQNSKAAGYDEIRAELLKSDIETASVILFVLFEHIWQWTKFRMTGTEALS